MFNVLNRSAMQKHLFLFAALLLSLAACHKDDSPQGCPPDLPCATQTGENTFGCYINGKPWVAEIAPYVLDPTLHKIEAEYDEDGYGSAYGNFLSIKAGRTNDTTDGFMRINIKPITATGPVSYVSAVTFDIGGYIVKTDHGNFVSVLAFDIDTLRDYKIDITHLDKDKNVMSGTFSFIGKTKTDTVRITDGRFDIRYDPY